MGKYIIGFVTTHIKGVTIALVSAIALGTIATVLVVQSGLDENIQILESGLNDVPSIKNDDLQELGKIYSKLNDQFEREIDTLVSGKADRNNKANKELTHYGAFGQENEDPFKNNDYINGANIRYQKATASIVNGESNFNDILAVMAVLYDQKMDMANIDEMKEVFTDLFWMSHTFTFDSTELYPCKRGCCKDTYKCTDVYNDYKNTRYLKYDPLKVRKHNTYPGYDPDEDFRMVLPEGECAVHGKSEAGCVWNSSRVCYHGSGQVGIASCNKSEVCNDGDAIVYSEVGDVFLAETIDPQYIVEDPSVGGKMNKNDNKCDYYIDVKYCKTRERLAKKLSQAKDSYMDALEAADKHYSQNNHTKTGSCCDRVADRVDRAEAKVNTIQSQLDSHIVVCENNDINAKYWCDGYKLCLGHRTSYSCPGHKIVICLGHTTLNVTVKVLYKDELLDLAYENIK